MNQETMLKYSTSNIVWLATALLHIDNKTRKVFQAKEIFKKVKELGILKTSDATIRTYISHHCVANEDPSPNKDRKLFREDSGYRLYKEGDKAEKREGGRSAPTPAEIPDKFQNTLDWYHKEYNNQDTERVYGYSHKDGAMFVSFFNEKDKAEIPKGIINILKPKQGEALLFEHMLDGTIKIKKVST